MASAGEETKTADPVVVYDDCYVTLTEKTLVLKWYYFPFATSKTIPLGDIDRIRPGTDPELALTWYKKKTWGQALSDVWWASRCGREFQSDNSTNFVLSVKQEGSGRSGFSVEDPKAFSSLAEKYIKA